MYVPGDQVQYDFKDVKALIDGSEVKLHLFTGLFRLLSGFGHEVEASAVEIYRAHEVALITKAARRVFDPLNA